MIFGLSYSLIFEKDAIDKGISITTPTIAESTEPILANTLKNAFVSIIQRNIDKPANKTKTPTVIKRLPITSQASLAFE